MHPFRPPFPAEPATAVAAACAAIAEAFGPAAMARRHRQAAKAVLRAPASGRMPEDAAGLAPRYATLAETLPEDLAGALAAVETRLAQERALHRRYAAGAWFLRPSRTRLAILTEARLILRFARRRGAETQFALALQVITAPPWARHAAE